MVIYNFASQSELEAAGEQLAAALVSVYGEDTVKARIKALGIKPSTWPDEYINRETRKVYKPHHEAERSIVYSDTPYAVLAKGGEGSGKSVMGIIKTLNRIKRGMSGIFASNSLPHFASSAWVELRRWMPWEMVHDKCRNMEADTWEPYKTIFPIVFKNGATLLCGGMEDPSLWRGPNINFACVDEVSRQKTADVIKYLTGRIRIPGPNGEPPQIWFTTTPAKNWLYDYFGPMRCLCETCNKRLEIAIQEGKELVCPDCGNAELKVDDEREPFKRRSKVVTLSTLDNEKAGNVQEGYVADRALTLNESEARVWLDAEWEDVEAGQPFLPSMLWWDQCQGDIPPLDNETPVVVIADAATGRQTEESDCFAIAIISRDPNRKKDAVMVRYAKIWQAARGQKIDFRGSPHNPGPERELLRMCGWSIDDNQEMVKVGGGLNVKCIAYDPRDLHDLGQRFRRKRVTYMKEFGQVKDRTEADTDLLHLILEKRITHNGDRTLREHIYNADRKTDDFGHHLRIVKRDDPMKIDLAVCVSMGAYTCLHLNL